MDLVTFVLINRFWGIPPVAGNPIEYFSYSRLSTYDNCQFRFKLQYIDKLSKPDESIEAFVGKRVHETLEYLYTVKQENDITPVFDDLLVFYHGQWEKSWHNRIGRYQTRLPVAYYLQLGEACIARYYRTHYPFAEPVIGIEKEIEFLLDNEPHLRFKGIIDRIDRSGEGVLTITDYKTGKRAMSQNKADSDLQLTIYQAGAEAAGWNGETTILTWHFLQVGKTVKSIRTRMQHEALKQKVKRKAEKILDHIENGQPFYTKENILCNWCYYWEECPAKRSTNPFSGNS